MRRKVYRVQSRNTGEPWRTLETFSAAEGTEARTAYRLHAAKRYESMPDIPVWGYLRLVQGTEVILSRTPADRATIRTAGAACGEAT